MARILAIDYGKKRCGIAVTDTSQIIASGLDTIQPQQLIAYLEKYFIEEEVEAIVLGDPKHSDGTPTYLATEIDDFIQELNKKFPNIKVHKQDESFTSVEASNIILQSGVNKKKRRDKSLLDKISAVIILQRFLEEQRNIQR